MSVVGYARVSTTGQSLEAQLQALEAAGAEKIYQEKVSGVKQDRPELAALLDYVREGDMVVVSRLDRLARSTRHLLEISDDLTDRGVQLKVLGSDIDTSSSHGRLVLSILGSIAQFERELMLERQREGIALAKEAGRYRGRKPTARAKSQEVWRLLDEGVSKSETAKRLGIGRSSVHRIVSAGRPK
nr:recombinase family protein [uncultured Desulfuromonas sp.]